MALGIGRCEWDAMGILTCFTHVTSSWALWEHCAVLKLPSFKKFAAGAGQRGGIDIIMGRVGRSQASAWFCAKHVCYFRVISFPIWMTVRNWRALTQRSMKLREAAGAQCLEKSELVVEEACSPFSSLEISASEPESICKQTQTLWNLNPRIKGEGPNCWVQWGRNKGNLVVS